MTDFINSIFSSYINTLFFIFISYFALIIFCKKIRIILYISLGFLFLVSIFIALHIYGYGFDNIYFATKIVINYISSILSAIQNSIIDYKNICCFMAFIAIDYYMVYKYYTTCVYYDSIAINKIVFSIDLKFRTIYLYIKNKFINLPNLSIFRFSLRI